MDYLDLVISGKATEIQHATNGYEYKDNARHIVCNDGVTLSVQGSHTHYCRPRDNYGPYYLMEVGFPTVEPPETWAEYFDGDWDEDDRTKSVYGYVPVELIREYVELHGGIWESKNPIDVFIRDLFD